MGIGVYVSVGAGTDVKVFVGKGVYVSVGAGAEVKVSVGEEIVVLVTVGIGVSDADLVVGVSLGLVVNVAVGRLDVLEGAGVFVGEGPIVGVCVIVAVPDGAGEGVDVQVGGEHM